MGFEAFLDVHGDRIHYMIHRLGIKGDWYDEFYGEGLVALWQAYQEFEGDRAEVGTFLNYRIRFRLIDVMRKKLRDKEKEQLAYDGLVQVLDCGNRHRASGVGLVDPSGLPVADSVFWEQVRELVTERQWLWIYYFIICDLTVKEIMELEGVSADAVKGWGRAARERLRDERVRRLLEELV